MTTEVLNSGNCSNGLHPWTGNSGLSKLCNLLRNEGHRVLSGNSAFTLTTEVLAQLNTACRRHSIVENDIAAADMTSSDRSFVHLTSRMRAQQEANKLKIEWCAHIQFIKDFMLSTPSLKLIRYSHTLSSPISLHHFGNLTCLNLRKVPIHMVEGLHKLRGTLISMTVYRSVDRVKDLLECCGGDMTSPMVWPQLKFVSFMFNSVSALDDSLRLLPHVEVLDLSHNSLETCDKFLKYLGDVQRITLAYNSLTCVPLISLTTRASLTCLVLRGNNLDGVKGLEVFTALQELDLGENCISDHSFLDPLGSLIRLKQLHLDGNPVFYHKKHRLLTIACLASQVVSMEFELDKKKLTTSEISKAEIKRMTTSHLSSLNPVVVRSHTPDSDYGLSPSSGIGTENESVQSFVSSRSSKKSKRKKLRARYTEIMDLENSGDASSSRDITPGTSPHPQSLEHQLRSRREEAIKTKVEIEELRRHYGPNWLQAIEDRDIFKIKKAAVTPDLSDAEATDSDNGRSAKFFVGSKTSNCSDLKHAMDKKENKEGSRTDSDCQFRNGVPTDDDLYLTDTRANETNNPIMAAIARLAAGYCSTDDTDGRNESSTSFQFPSFETEAKFGTGSNFKKSGSTANIKLEYSRVISTKPSSSSLDLAVTAANEITANVNSQIDSDTYLEKVSQIDVPTYISALNNSFKPSDKFSLNENETTLQKHAELVSPVKSEGEAYSLKQNNSGLNNSMTTTIDRNFDEVEINSCDMTDLLEKEVTESIFATLPLQDSQMVIVALTASYLVEKDIRGKVTEKLELSSLTSMEWRKMSKNCDVTFGKSNEAFCENSENKFEASEVVEDVDSRENKINCDTDDRDQINCEANDGETKINGESSKTEKKIHGEASKVENKISGETSDRETKINGEASKPENMINGEVSKGEKMIKGETIDRKKEMNGDLYDRDKKIKGEEAGVREKKIMDESDDGAESMQLDLKFDYVRKDRQSRCYIVDFTDGNIILAHLQPFLDSREDKEKAKPMVIMQCLRCNRTFPKSELIHQRSQLPTSGSSRDLQSIQELMSKTTLICPKCGSSIIIELEPTSSTVKSAGSAVSTPVGSYTSSTGTYIDQVKKSASVLKKKNVETKDSQSRSSAMTKGRDRAGIIPPMLDRSAIVNCGEQAEEEGLMCVEDHFSASAMTSIHTASNVAEMTTSLRGDSSTRGSKAFVRRASFRESHSGDFDQYVSKIVDIKQRILMDSGYECGVINGVGNPSRPVSIERRTSNFGDEGSGEKEEEKLHSKVRRSSMHKNLAAMEDIVNSLVNEGNSLGEVFAPSSCSSSKGKSVSISAFMKSSFVNNRKVSDGSLEGNDVRIGLKHSESSSSIAVLPTPVSCFNFETHTLSSSVPATFSERDSFIVSSDKDDTTVVSPLSSNICSSMVSSVYELSVNNSESKSGTDSPAYNDGGDINSTDIADGIESSTYAAAIVVESDSSSSEDLTSIYDHPREPKPSLRKKHSKLKSNSTLSATLSKADASNVEDTHDGILHSSFDSQTNSRTTTQVPSGLMTSLNKDSLLATSDLVVDASNKTDEESDEDIVPQYAFHHLNHRLTLYMMMSLFGADEEFVCKLQGEVVQYILQKPYEGILVMSSSRFYILKVTSMDHSQPPDQWLSCIEIQPIPELRYIDVGLGGQSLRLEFVTDCSSYTFITRNRDKTTQFVEVLHSNLAKYAVSQGIAFHVIVNEDVDPTTLSNLDRDVISKVTPDQKLLHYCIGFIERGNQKHFPVSFVITTSDVCLVCTNHQWPQPRLQAPVTEETVGKQFTVLERQKISNVASVEVCEATMKKIRLELFNETEGTSLNWNITLATRQSTVDFINALSEPWAKEFGVEMDVVYAELPF